MEWSDQIKLIDVIASGAVNENGFPTAPEETERTVFANKKSVGNTEFYSASQAGYKAQIKFDVFSAEYAGEEIVEYPVGSGKRYRVLRTYLHGDGEYTELTLCDLPAVQGGAADG